MKIVSRCYLSNLILLVFNISLIGAIAETIPSPIPGVTVSPTDQTAATHRIDRLINAKRLDQGIEANRQLTEAQFLRRVYMELAGRAPSLNEANQYLNTKSTNKRTDLIGNLLRSEAFVSHSYNYWADVLRIMDGLSIGAKETGKAYKLWMKNAIRTNLPYDQLVYQLVSAQGTNFENGAIGYYLRDRGMNLDNMSNTARIFLGTRLECAQCHDHPYDEWTQMDYYKMATYSYNVDTSNNSNGKNTWNSHFKGIRLESYREAVADEDFPYFQKEQGVTRFINGKKSQTKLTSLGLSKAEFQKIALKGIAAETAKRTEIMDLRLALRRLFDPIRYVEVGTNNRQLKLPHDYQYDDAKPHDVVTPLTIFGDDVEVAESLTAQPRLDAYARWLTSEHNPRFTKVIVNRLWKRVFGVALIEPFDDISEESKSSHPELLVYLEQLMLDLDYDTRAFLEILYSTDTYQRQAEGTVVAAGSPYYFPGPLLRRLSAEQIWDSLVAALIEYPDHYQPGLENDLKLIARQKIIYEKLNSLDSETIELVFEKATKLVTETSGRIEPLRSRIKQAREDGRDQLAKKLTEQLKTISKSPSRKIMRILLEEDAETNDDHLAMAAQFGLDDETLQKIQTTLPKPTIPEIGIRAKGGSHADKESKKLAKLKHEQLKQQNKLWKKHAKDLMRASELPSPAPRGHFLREFGQSDREVIDNANDAASVPQALNLLNGVMAQSISNSNSYLAKQMAKQTTPEEKMETLYLALLSRRPSSRELPLLMAEYEQSGEQAFDNVAWALINSSQFLFLQ